MRSSAILLILFLLCALTGAKAQQAALEQDARVIELLRQNGSDLTKPHRIDFFFVLPTRPSAESLAKEVQSLGFSVIGIKRLRDSLLWELQAQRLSVPELASMRLTTVQLTALAAQFGGEYEGWGAPIAK